MFIADTTLVLSLQRSDMLFRYLTWRSYGAPAGLYSKIYKHVAPPEQSKSKIIPLSASDLGYDGSWFGPSSS